jgi:hypothetical protein
MNKTAVGTIVFVALLLAIPFRAVAGASGSVLREESHYGYRE